MLLTAFASGIVALVVILFIVRSWRRNKESREQLDKERKEGIID